MTLLDLIVLLLLLLTVLRGLMRGFVGTLFSLGAWLLAFFAGKWGALLVGPWLPFGADNPGIQYFAGFVVVFLAVLIGVLLLGHVLGAVVAAAGLGPVDTVLGGVLGLAKGGVILVGLTLAAGLTALPRTDFWQKAAFSGSLQTMAHAVLPLLPNEIAKHVRFEHK
ncbi:MAG: CvpA family protein [Thiobacillus sp.]|nr:CvpA family protein [Thiobacillus sp.]